MKINFKLLLGNIYEKLNDIEDDSINSIITSPPYYNLRDYKNIDQIGIEPTQENYIEKILDVTLKLKTKMTIDGTCFINIGDTYIDKSLSLIPYKIAIGMQTQGWIIRNILIWHKPNAMPSPVKNRWCVDFEPIIFATRSEKYKYNQVLEEYTTPLARWGGHTMPEDARSEWDKDVGQKTYRKRNVRPNPLGRKPRAVWSIPTKPSNDKHSAAFPEKLVEKCILSGSKEHDTILDPFCGRGTTGIVALKNNRNFIGIELNQDYYNLSLKNLQKIAS